MKKFFALALALVLTFAMAVTCFAATLTAPGQTTGGVYATYVPAAAAGTVYQVDVAFGEMQFTYTPEGNGEWDTENHQYVNKAAPKWEAAGNTITVTNHSNAAVTVNLSYKAATGFEAATASFDKTTFTLGSADVEFKAVSDSATLTMGGSIPAGTNGQIGTITVAFQ